MGEPVTLRNEDVGRIGEYVKPWLRELVDQMVPRAESAGIGNLLLGRMVRVEEELKTQRELMDERFGFMERRFGSVDKRFATLTWMVGVGFVVITSLTTVFALLS